MKRIVGGLVVLIVAAVSLSAASFAYAATNPAFSYPILKFTPSGAELIIPTPACPTASPTCQWMLLMNEPDVAGQPQVGDVVGTSGILMVAYPTGFCGVVQADALRRLTPTSPWVSKRGIRTTIPANSCGTTATSEATTQPSISGSSSTTATTITSTTMTPTTPVTVSPTTTPTTRPSTKPSHGQTGSTSTTTGGSTSTTSGVTSTTSSTSSSSGSQPIIKTGGPPIGPDTARTIGFWSLVVAGLAMVACGILLQRGRRRRA